MRRAALFALLLLAACGRGEAPAPAEGPSFRDRGAPIASTTRGGPADLNGEWRVSQALGRVPFANGSAAGGRVTVEMDADGAGRWVFTDSAGTWVAVPVAATAPGRFAPPSDQPAARMVLGTPRPEFWVLWVDDDFRTAAVGTPDGSFGWIMDRPGQASPDRAAAAREMMDFNGYDTGRLAP